MINRKGFLATTLCLTIWMVPVNADETADDIVAMMGWWDEYGRYWDEIGADTSAGMTNDFSFAWLEGVWSEEELLEGKAEEVAVVAKRSKQ